MLICKPEIANYVLETKFKDCVRDRKTIVGSNLEDDIKQQEYNHRSLSNIIHYVEGGISIVLNNMDRIYSSLYDLFN